MFLLYLYSGIKQVPPGSGKLHCFRDLHSSTQRCQSFFFISIMSLAKAPADRINEPLIAGAAGKAILAVVKRLSEFDPLPGSAVYDLIFSFGSSLGQILTGPSSKNYDLKCIQYY